MSILTRALIGSQFKLGIYEARQIIRIEHRSVVVSEYSSKYQPGHGIRYELSPDQWFLYTYCFFPRYQSKDFYNNKFLKQELYYDYFAKNNTAGSLYIIFRNKSQTGYIIEESYVPFNPEVVKNDRTKRYTGYFINTHGLYFYNEFDTNNVARPVYYANNFLKASCYILSDWNGFEKIKISLSSMNKECASINESYEAYPGLYILHDKLKSVLEDCHNADYYIKNCQ